jgi:hypothetical protein
LIFVEGAAQLSTRVVLQRAKFGAGEDSCVEPRAANLNSLAWAARGVHPHDRKSPDATKTTTLACTAGIFATSTSRLAAAPGGWGGWRDFVIESTKPECEVIRSFILVPKDGKGIMRHKAGQYLTFALELPGSKDFEAGINLTIE